jgi:hypothetical protein
MAGPNFAQLKSALQTSGLQQRDNALFQVINQLITFLDQFQNTTVASIGSGGSGGSFASKNATYLTASNQVALLPQSRELLAGTNVSFDDSVVNQRTVNVSVSDQDFVVMSDGGIPNAQPLNDGAGSFIYTPYTP